ncbi:MAG TPA: Adventurous gliding motility protein K, partial [Myxococcaceae bacterium]|nr:Adventurous gliding motility protein K [Myxococcaceae bacterium]
LQDRRKAWVALDRALAAQPTHGGALELKAQLAMEAERYADAAHALSLRVQQGGDAQRIAALHLQLGGLYQDRLSDLTRAAAHLQTSLAANPRSPEALERLAHIHTSARNWTGAADALKRLIELGGQPAEVARRTMALARVLDEGMGDAAQATALYRRALDMAPGDDGVIQRLVELYEKMGNLRGLVELLEQQAHASADLHRAVQLRLKVAEIYAGPLADPQKALGHYRFVVERDPINASAHAALAALYTRDGATTPLAIEHHRQLLRLEPTRVDSLHALFRLWEGVRQNDKAFCAGGALAFFRGANEAEAAFYNEAKNRVPTEVPVRLQATDIDALMHPRLRNSPVLEVIRAIGDQLGKLHPPNFEAAGIDRKTDRLKPDHAVFKAVRAVAQVFEVEEFEVYQSRRGAVFLETSEPLAVCVAQDMVRKFNAREQKFLFGKAALGLFNKSAVLDKISTGEATDLIGNAVRIFSPDYSLGRRNDEVTKQLKKTLSRKALKQLEAAALTISTAEVDVVQTLEWLAWSGNRAGLVMCGDVAAGLNLIVRHDANQSSPRAEPSEPVAHVVESRLDLRDALGFVLSDEFFKLRQKLGLGV